MHCKKSILFFVYRFEKKYSVKKLLLFNKVAGKLSSRVSVSLSVRNLMYINEKKVEPTERKIGICTACK